MKIVLRRLRLLLAAVFLFVGASAASACVCDGEQTVKESFREASAIFTGRFLRSEYRRGIRNEMHEIGLEAWGKKGEPYEVLVYIFEADRWWKGAGTREVVLITDNTRAPDGSESVSDCGLGFETGHRYLIYAYGKGDGLDSNACSRTRNIKRAAPDIRQLDRLRSARGRR